MTDPDLDLRVKAALDRVDPPVAPTVGTADTVNIAPGGKVPHPKWLMWFSAALVAGFSTVSLIVLLNNYDGLTKGLIIGTWNTMAVGTFTFWLGSSSAGKAQAKP